MNQRIKNKRYRKFLDEGIIQTLKQEQVIQILQNIKSRNILQARALFLILYFTGARPNEVLRLQAKDITLEKPHLLIKLQGSKKGLPRTVYLPYSNALVQDIYKYSNSTFSEVLLFHNYISQYIRTVKTKKGIIQRKELSTKLYYYIQKWTRGVLEEELTPYFLRHNRFSKLSENGITMEQLRMMKGSRTLDSVTPYLHLSTEISKKISKKIN
jgi:site-specific recombinase XerD